MAHVLPRTLTVVDWVLRLLLGNKGLFFTMLLSEFVYLLRFLCILRCERIPHILVCKLLPRQKLMVPFLLSCLFLLDSFDTFQTSHLLMIIRDIKFESAHWTARLVHPRTWHALLFFCPKGHTFSTSNIRTM